MGSNGYISAGNPMQNSSSLDIPQFYRVSDAALSNPQENGESRIMTPIGSQMETPKQ